MSAPRTLFDGLGCLLQGFRVIATQPKLFVLGMVPPLVMSVLLVAGYVWLLLNVGQFAGSILTALPWTTAGGVWQVLLAILLALGALLLIVLTFSTITLALGSPIYDIVSAGVDRTAGPVPPDAADPVARMIPRVIWQALVTIILSAVGALVCFLLGLVPALGSVVGVLASWTFGGWMMTRELIGPTCDRRGMFRLADRRRMLGRHPAATLGFGIPAFWLLSLPLVSVVVFPAAVAGATLLARGMLENEPAH